MNRVLARLDADERAGRRFALAGAGLLVLAVLVGVLGALVETRWDPLIDLDRSTTREAEELGWAVTPAKVLTHLGDPLWLTVATAVMVVLLWRHHHHRLALFVFSTRLVAVLLSTTIKAVVDRARPVFVDPVDTAHGSSFPSGHALGAAAFWATVAVVVLTLWGRRHRWVVLLALALPLVTAATRVLLGVHYLSDVTAGLILGYGVVLVATALFVVWTEEETGRDVEPLEEGLGRDA